MANMKWQLIYRDLKERLAVGNLSGENSLPTEQSLSEQYHCSRPTVRKALVELREAGLLTRASGAGMYLNSKSAQHEAPKAEEKRLGLISPDLGPAIVFDPLCKHLVQYASFAGHSILWNGYLPPDSPQLTANIRQICERYIEQHISGLFFCPFEYHASCKEVNELILGLFSQAHIPVVLLDSSTAPPLQAGEYDVTSLNHMQSAFILTHHLIERGYDEIYFLIPPYSHTSAWLRFMGYREAMLERGLMPHAVIEATGDDVQAVSGFTSQRRGRYAVICSTDFTAMKFIKTLSSLGLSVPEDLAVAGFDSLSASMLFSHTITSIEQPFRQICLAAIELMTSRIASPGLMAREVLFAGSLAAGNTT